MQAVPLLYRGDGSRGPGVLSQGLQAGRGPALCSQSGFMLLFSGYSARDWIPFDARLWGPSESHFVFLAEQL